MYTGGFVFTEGSAGHIATACQKFADTLPFIKTLEFLLPFSLQTLNNSSQNLILSIENEHIHPQIYHLESTFLVKAHIKVQRLFKS